MTGKSLLAKPSEIKSKFKRGGRSYVLVDMQTDTARLDDRLIEEQAKFDGIHVVKTSLSAPAKDVVDIYGNLWRIENSFRTLKSQLRIRPIFVRIPEHVRGHFLICYLALCLHRYLEYKLHVVNKRASTDRIIDALNAASISLIKPTKNVETYGTEGFDQTTCDIMEVAGLKVPEIYESSGSMRKKLRILCAMKDLFAHSTTVE